MSVLSSPQGSPERVWSLLAGLQALGGRAERSLIDGLVNPGYLVGDASVLVETTLASNTHGAATSLGFLALDGREAVVDAAFDAATADDFADRVHDRLIALEDASEDTPLLETYAWLAVETDRRASVGWIFDVRREDLADQASAALGARGEDARTMNPTKWVAWRRWMAFLGLSVRQPFTNSQDLPDPTRRLLRELERETLAPGARLAAHDFLQLVARRLPYLDRGRLFSKYATTLSHAQSNRRVSPLLSFALGQLHAEGRITLLVSGDSANVVTLSGVEGMTPSAFDAVVVNVETAA
ncbi:hypothetical protein [Brevundimonas sp. UBA7534]|uniref:hypothetical protein n=1 Tax=Brevundimonas sp. UBA7534 TaxID=1946138 RepID=UPI0025C2D9ED|nr:hypothetical protein [Brevundimonas sp. UBA7534]